MLPQATYTHIHTHPFNGPFPGLPRWAGTRKVKPIWILLKQETSEWQWHQLGHMQVCTSLQTDNHASTPPLIFYWPDALPAAQPTASKHWRHLRLLTHTHLTALFPGLPGSAGTRKVKPIWILLKQETVSGSGISWAICKSAPRFRQITMPAPHHSFFTGRTPFLPPNQQRQSTEGNQATYTKI